MRYLQIHLPPIPEIPTSVLKTTDHFCRPNLTKKYFSKTKETEQNFNIKTSILKNINFNLTVTKLKFNSF